MSACRVPFGSDHIFSEPIEAIALSAESRATVAASASIVATPIAPMVL